MKEVQDFKKNKNEKIINKNIFSILQKEDQNVSIDKNLLKILSFNHLGI